MKSITKPFHQGRSIIRDTWKQMKEAQLLLVASSLAYVTILSVIPLLAVSFAVFQAFGGVERLYAVIEPIIISNLTEGTSKDVINYIHGFITNVHTSTVGVGGFLGLLLTSMIMLSNIESAFNQVWRARNTRTFFQRFSAYWLFITLGPLAFSIVIGIATSSHFPVARLLPNAASAMLITIGLLFLVYKYVPNCVVRPRFALASAVITTIAFDLTRLGYNFYINRFATYNKIYGSLGAVPIILFWIYIVWVILLTGAALTSAMQKRLDPNREPTNAPHHR